MPGAVVMPGLFFQEQVNVYVPEVTFSGFLIYGKCDPPQRTNHNNVV